jgi:ribonuclease D
VIYLHKGDIPKDVVLNGDIAIDCEAMGLNHHRDRLCLIQISGGNGDAHLIQFVKDQYSCPVLKEILRDKSRTKIFHYARFDVATINKYLGVEIENIYCTKIASKLVRTYTDSHGLKDLCRELLNITISKQQQSSYWGGDVLTEEQKHYAATDVLHLHVLRNKLDDMLKKENRLELAYKCFDFIQTRTQLDLQGWSELDIFAH